MSMEPYSPEALEKQRHLDEKTARGEIPSWSDLHGILQPNPELPQCPAWEDLDYQCERARGHEGPHRHVIEWGAP